MLVLRISCSRLLECHGVIKSVQGNKNARSFSTWLKEVKETHSRLVKGLNSRYNAGSTSPKAAPNTRRSFSSSWARILLARTRIVRHNTSKAQSGLVIYHEGGANKRMLLMGRLFIIVQLTTFLLGAETIYMVRTTDEIEQEVNPEVQMNLYTGNYGFVLLPTIICLATLITTGGFFFFGRVIKKILYTPSNGAVTFITHHLAGGENIRTTEVGKIMTRNSMAKVDGYSWGFIVSQGAEVTNKPLFNMVMGVSDLH